MEQNPCTDTRRCPQELPLPVPDEGDHLTGMSLEVFEDDGRGWHGHSLLTLLQTQLLLTNRGFLYRVRSSFHSVYIHPHLRYCLSP